MRGQDTPKEKKYSIFEIPKECLRAIFWPIEALLVDKKTNCLDETKHPVYFYECEYNTQEGIYEYYGFRLTSHPKCSTEFDDLFVVKVDKEAVEIDKNKQRESTFIHCENIDVFETGGQIHKNFKQHGSFPDVQKWQEVLTEMITKHVLLQENGLTVPDENTELLLIFFNLTREEIIESERYKDYQSIINHRIYAKKVQKIREEISHICQISK